VIDKPSENPNNVSISDVDTQSDIEHLSSDKYNGNDGAVHVDAQPDNDKEPDNEVETEPPADIDNHLLKRKYMIKRISLLENTGNKVQRPYN
jgi:hypothetical protein